VRESFQQVLEAVVRPPCPQFQGMLLGCVVMESRIRRKAGDPTDQQIGLGWVQIAAGRIGAKRPADIACLLPGRDRQ
jgi:hypothetical protein